MAKLDQSQKQTFKNCREFLAEFNMRVFFSRELRMMVGILPDEVDNGTIYKMCVTLCHKNDKFKKKLGLIELCRKFEDDNFNQVRILSPNVEDFVEQYMGMFCNYGEFDFQEMELN